MSFVALVDLNGIDDPVARREIIRAAYLRGWRFGDLLLIVVLGGIVGAAISVIARRFIGSSGSYLGAALGVLAGNEIYRAIVRQRFPEILPELLKSLNRCPDCGYKRETGSPHSVPCPECGAVLADVIRTT